MLLKRSFWYNGYIGVATCLFLLSTLSSATIKLIMSLTNQNEHKQKITAVHAISFTKQGTFLASIRTSITIMAFGFVVVRFSFFKAKSPLC